MTPAAAMRNLRNRLLPPLSALLLCQVVGGAGAPAAAAADVQAPATAVADVGAPPAAAGNVLAPAKAVADVGAPAAAAGDVGAPATAAADVGAPPAAAGDVQAPAKAVADVVAPPAVAGGLPPAPRNLSARTLGSDSIGLGWVGRPGAAGEFRVERAVLGGSFSEVGATTATSAVVSGLAAATGYVFRVRARNARGDSPYSNQAVAATLAVVGPCIADVHTLCLHGGRFRATASWSTATGSGAAEAAPWSADDSALLWFFQPDNWELLVKVIDGCAVNQRFWVFYAATSDVQYSIAVSDTQTGATRVYFHPPGSLASPTADTGALAVCP
jgi:hypothetical protein